MLCYNKRSKLCWQNGYQNTMLYYNERTKWCMLWAVISVKSFLSFCNCIGAHFCNNKNQAILQQKNKIILVTWVSEHHDILQWKNNIIIVTWVSEHHAILQWKSKMMFVKWVTVHHDIFQWKCKIMLVKWVSEHYAILQWKSKIMYTVSCNFSQVIPIFLQFYRCSFL
jgi:hypothetical protein